MAMTLDHRMRIVREFLNRLRRQTGNATGGVWVGIHQEAGEILLDHLPAIWQALPADADQLELAEAGPSGEDRRIEINQAVAAVQDVAKGRGQ